MTDLPVLGRYRLISLLGEGGMGKVYKGYDAALERHVAIKILPPELVADASRVSRFVQEAKTASALNHPHVVAIYDIGEEPGGNGSAVRYIAMELVDGQTLRELLSSGTPDIKKGLRIVAQVANALAAAHAAGIIHRDLKPENIMVTLAGYAKVLDFGLAKLRHDDGPEPELRTAVKGTDPGSLMGTPGYMSPEQAQAKVVDHRTDIFSLGSIVYELATGRRAFHGDSPVDTLHQIIHTDPEPIRSVRGDAPPELIRIVRKALAKDPDDRYQTMRDMAIDLRDLLREVESSTSGISTAAAVAPPRRQWVWPAVAILMVVLAALIMVFRPRPRVAPSPDGRSMRITRVTASGKVTGAAISPDGKFVAYSYSDQGEQSLWVRQMASGQSLELLPQRRVAVWGMAFSPDGSIYFGERNAGVTSGAIYQISPLGGAPRKIIEEIDSQPTFSPDGKRMAFLRTRFPTPDESALMVANIDGSEARPLATARTPEFFVPVFYAGASWSPDGKVIATAMNRLDGNARIVGVDTATGAVTTIAKGDWPLVAQVAWLPDQSALIAIMQTSNDRRAQVWYVPYPEGQPTPITKDLFDYRMASVTADGTSLLTVAADVAADIWINAEGATPKRITSAKLEGAFGVAPLADGRIVFTSLDTGKIDIWMMNADGSGRVLLTRDLYENRNPVVTPDGQSIVYLSATSKQNEICRMNLDGSGRRVLARSVTNSSIDVSPDGKWVLYETLIPEVSTPVIARVSTEGGKSMMLTNYLSIIPSYSPDGSRIAMYFQEKPGARFYLGIMAADGGPPLKRFEFPVRNLFSRIKWMPDGKALVVNTAPSDRGNLWLVPLDGSVPRRLTQFDERQIMAFAPLRAGKGWVISRGDQSRDAVLITGFKPGE